MDQQRQLQRQLHIRHECLPYWMQQALARNPNLHRELLEGDPELQRFYKELYPYPHE